MDKQRKILMKIFIVLIVVLIIVIGMAAIFGSKNNKESNNDESKNQYKDEELVMQYKPNGKYEPSVINTEYTLMTAEEVELLDEIIDMILEQINNKQYSDLYGFVSKIHKNIKFNTLDKFKKYIDTEFPANNYECLSYRIDMSDCYLKLSSGDQTKELKIIGFKSKEFLQICFEKFKSTQASKTPINVDGISINMKYIVEYEDGLSAFLSITNKNSENSKVLINQIKLIKILRGEETENTGKQTEEILIPANESKEVEIFFEDKDTLLFLPSFFECEVSVNGKVQNKKVTIIYPEAE